MNKNFWNCLLLSPFICFALFFVGCYATGKIVDYDPATTTPTERVAKQSGVEVALDPFIENERSKEYFKINATSDGVAILHVRIVNETADQTFLVEKKNFQLTTDQGSGSTGASNKIERSKKDADTILWIGAVTGSLGLFQLGAAMASRSSEIQRNFVSKEMGDQTLSPGQSMEGFIYFTLLKPGIDWTHLTSVKASLTDTKSHQTILFSIPLSR